MRIAVAMSGGINSSLVAVMMKQVGYEIIGITAEWPEENSENKEEIYNKNSLLPGNIIAAKRTAKKYNLLHRTITLEETFFNEIQGILDSGEAGQVEDEIRKPAIFNWLFIKNITELAKTMGCRRLATGHYARIKRKNHGLYYIAEGLDRDSDHSQWLSLLTQDLLEFAMFPLGEYHRGAIEKKMKQNK